MTCPSVSCPSVSQQIDELFEKQGNKAISAFGEVLLDHKGVMNSKGHGMSREKAAAFASVKDVLESGVVIMPMGYHGVHGKKQATGMIAAPIEINGERRVCIVEVIKNTSNQRLYVHEVFDTNKLLVDDASNVVHDGQKSVSPHPQGEIAKVIKNLLISKQNSSKVVDENGEPMVVYHQTNSKQYINRETGENWDDLDWRERDDWDARDDWDEYWEEQDFYTFDNKNHGRRSVEMPAIFFSPVEDPYHEYGERTIAAFLNVRNPAINPEIEDAGVTSTAGEEAMNRLIEARHDGFFRIYEGEGKETWEYNAFYPNKIKSATENNGRFSKEDNDIRQRTSETSGRRRRPSDDVNGMRDEMSKVEAAEALAGKLGKKVRILRDVEELKRILNLIGSLDSPIILLLF